MMPTFVFSLSLQVYTRMVKLAACPWQCDVKERRTMIQHLGHLRFVSDCVSGNPESSHELQAHPWFAEGPAFVIATWTDGACVTGAIAHVCICRNAPILNESVVLQPSE